MPHYHLNLHNAHYDAMDEEGAHFTGIKQAYARALDSIRDFIGHEAMGGTIDFRGRVDIVDEKGTVLATVAFKDAFDIKGFEVAPVRRINLMRPDYLEHHKAF